MAVLKGNVVVRTQDGEIVKLPRGMSRDALEAVADDYGPEAEALLDSDGHWVEHLDDEPAQTNLLDSSERVIRPRSSREGRKARKVEDVVTEAKPRRGKAAETPEE